MKYRTRHLEKRLHALARHFKCVLVTGARQVGKSTLLAHAFPNLKSVTLDPIQDRFGVRRDPDLFLDNFPAPLIVDEIQFAPELLPALKRRMDQNAAPGQYFLSGSQNLALLRSVTESMAGRVGVLQLGVMTPLEILKLYPSTLGLPDQPCFWQSTGVISSPSEALNQWQAVRQTTGNHIPYISTTLRLCSRVVFFWYNWNLCLASN